MKKQAIRILVMVLIVTLTAGMCVACSKKKDKKSKLEQDVLKINDETLTLQDVMYAIYEAEEQVAYNEYYSTMLGSKTDFWEQVKKETNQSKQDYYREQVIETAVRNYVYYKEAKKDKMTLSKDDKSEISDRVDSLLKTMSKEDIKRTGFTKKNLTKQITQEQYAYNYYQKQLEGIKVDEDSLKKDYNKEDYVQYQINYIYAPTVDWDSDGNSVKLSDTEKKAMKKKIDGMYGKIKAGKSLEDAQGGDETTEYGTMSITDDDQTMPDEVVKAAVKLKNKEIHDGIITTSEGYYIVQMENNEDMTTLDEAINSAVNDEKSAQVEDKYQHMLKKYKYSEIGSTLKKLTFGNYAYIKSDDQSLEEDEEHDHTISNGTEDTLNIDEDTAN